MLWPCEPPAVNWPCEPAAYTRAGSKSAVRLSAAASSSSARWNSNEQRTCADASTLSTACADASKLSTSCADAYPAWARALCADLEPAAVRAFQHWGCIRYGSDGSGADAPWHALATIAKVLKAHSPKHCMASDVAVESQKFLRYNYPLNVLYAGNIMLRSNDGDHCVLQGRHVPFPDLDVYNACFVCRDLSPCNAFRQAKNLRLELKVKDHSGNSTRTLHASIQLIVAKQFPIVLFENVWAKAVLEVTVALLSRNGYAPKPFAINALTAGASTSRPRMFIVGVNVSKVRVTAPMTAWHDWVIERVRAMPDETVDSKLLPDNHPTVNMALSELQAGASTSRPRKWCEERKRHQRVRDTIVQSTGLEPPGIEDTIRECASSSWLRALPVRSQDAFGLHSWAATNLQQVDPSQMSLIWDMSSSICRAKSKSRKRIGKMDCITRTHRFIHTMKRRLITGYEMLALQDFHGVKFQSPDGTESLTDRAMVKLAGDTMTVRAIGLILLCVLCHTEKVDSSIGTLAGDANIDVGQVLQIGRYSGWPAKSTTAWDCLPDDEGESYRIQKKKAQAFMSSVVLLLNRGYLKQQPFVAAVSVTCSRLFRSVRARPTRKRRHIPEAVPTSQPGTCADASTLGTACSDATRKRRLSLGKAKKNFQCSGGAPCWPMDLAAKARRTLKHGV